MTPHKQNRRRPKIKVGIILALIALCLLALVAYQLHSGGTLKKVTMPGVFGIDFADQPAAAPTPEVSRDFIIGRWQVDQVFGQISGGTVVTYDPDGTFTGSDTIFTNDVGVKQSVTGHWNYEKLTKDTFRLKIEFSNSAPWQGTFKILDPDHIHNTDENYVAVRLK